MAKANEFQYIDISEILPYKNNPRINKEAIKVVEASIKEFGFQSPIVVSKDYEIIAGHTRFEAAKNLKYGRVPCIVAHSLDDLKAKAYRIVDNKSGELAQWDFDLLKLEMELMPDFDFNLLSLDFENNLQNEKNIQKDISDSIKETYEVVCECKNEKEQEGLFLRLNAEGIKCRILTL